MAGICIESSIEQRSLLSLTVTGSNNLQVLKQKGKY